MPIKLPAESGTPRKRLKKIESSSIFGGQAWFLHPIALQGIAEASRAAGSDDSNDDDQERDYVVTNDGVAIIDVQGPLTRGRYYRGISYSEIQEQSNTSECGLSCQSYPLQVR
jgi:hypothetical protein